ncbi:hypothetical protein [Ralstonia pickettii]|uniref:hypothetical protein n=1 Tax=Ralstonia pickettii TaxID=329 RepID=UPI0021756F2C|nr:hypothetical protein [Ralstonia pickettii]
MTAATIGLLVVFGSAQGSEARELICSGHAEYGEESFADRFFLRIEDGSIEIKGSPGSTYTFDGVSYSVCSESRDEIQFEYGIGKICGSGKPSRIGTLQKITGDLKLRRFDMGKRFDGNYTCRPAGRVASR